MCLPVHYDEECSKQVKGPARDTKKKKEEDVKVLVFVGFLYLNG